MKSKTVVQLNRFVMFILKRQSICQFGQTAEKCSITTEENDKESQKVIRECWSNSFESMNIQNELISILNYGHQVHNLIDMSCA